MLRSTLVAGSKTVSATTKSNRQERDLGELCSCPTSRVCTRAESRGRENSDRVESTPTRLQSEKRFAGWLTHIHTHARTQALRPCLLVRCRHFFRAVEGAAREVSLSNVPFKLAAVDGVGERICPGFPPYSIACNARDRCVYKYDYNLFPSVAHGWLMLVAT